MNAIPYVVAADPGIKTYLDLPLIAGRAHPDLGRAAPATCGLVTNRRFPGPRACGWLTKRQAAAPSHCSGDPAAERPHRSPPPIAELLRPARRVTCGRHRTAAPRGHLAAA